MAVLDNDVTEPHLNKDIDTGMIEHKMMQVNMKMTVQQETRRTNDDNNVISVPYFHYIDKLVTLTMTNSFVNLLSLILSSIT